MIKDQSLLNKIIFYPENLTYYRIIAENNIWFLCKPISNNYLINTYIKREKIFMEYELIHEEISKHELSSVDYLDLINEDDYPYISGI